MRSSIPEIKSHNLIGDGNTNLTCRQTVHEQLDCCIGCIISAKNAAAVSRSSVLSLSKDLEERLKFGRQRDISLRHTKIDHHLITQLVYQLIRDAYTSATFRLQARARTTFEGWKVKPACSNYLYSSLAWPYFRQSVLIKVEDSMRRFG
jgi:hypothetical protein